MQYHSYYSYPINRDFNSKATLEPSEVVDTQFYSDELLKYLLLENQETELYIFAKDTEGTKYKQKLGTAGKLINILSR